MKELPDLSLMLVLELAGRCKLCQLHFLKQMCEVLNLFQSFVTRLNYSMVLMALIFKRGMR